MISVLKNMKLISCFLMLINIFLIPLNSVICFPQYTINIHIPNSVFYKTNGEQDVQIVFTLDGIGDIDYGLITFSTDNRNYITNSLYLENGIESYNFTTKKMYFRQIEVFDNTKLNRQLYDSWAIIIAPTKLNIVEYHLIKGYFKLDISATNIGRHYITIQFFIKSSGENYIFSKEYEYFVYRPIDKWYSYISPLFAGIIGSLLTIGITIGIPWIRDRNIKTKFPSARIMCAQAYFTFTRRKKLNLFLIKDN